MGDLDLTVLRDRDDVLAMGSEWDALYAECADRRFSHARYWCQRMWLQLDARSGRHPLVIVGREGGRCRLIWPLVTYRALFWRVTQPMFEDLSDYDDILVADHPRADVWCRQAWSRMIKETRPDIVVCRRVRDGSALDGLIGSERWRWERQSSSPYVDFGRVSDWDSYVNALSKKTRSTNRNRRNRLARFGEPGFSLVTDPHRAVGLIDWMFEEKHRRLGLRAHSREEKTTCDTFGHDMPFLTDVTRHAYDSGELNVFELSAAGETVAVLTGVMTGKSMIGWLFAYHPDYMSAAPGRLVLLETLEWACRNGIEIVDFLPDPEPYKAEWTGLAHGVRDVRLPVTWWGKARVAWYRSPFRQMLIWLYKHLPKPVQQWIRRFSF